ncbi:sigma-70 family RNA polymerase sigma factor [Fusobacterium varium]|jgi:RNA polymerase sporulation-specific sigma factor
MLSVQTIRAAQNGDEDAIQLIFQTLRQLILYKTKNYFFQDGDREDVIQEARIGLLKAIKAYNENKKTSFSNFALLCIKRHLITMLKTSSSGKNRILNMAILNSSEIEDDSKITYENRSFNFYNPEEIYLSKEKIKFLNKYLKSHLSPMEKQIFEYMLLGLTYIEISKKTKRDLKSVDNSIHRIKTKIKKFILEYEQV